MINQAHETDRDDDGPVSGGQRLRTGVRWTYRIGRYINDLVSFLGTKTGIAATVAASGAGAISATAIHQPAMLGLKPKSTAVAIETRKLDNASLLYPVEGVDAAGRRVLFDLVVLSRDLTWVRGSDKDIARGDRALSSDEIGQTVLGPQLRSAMAAAKEVIAVGAASIEGAEADEAKRAERRALTASGWLERAVPDAVPISALNLGQFRSDCAAQFASDTAWQRPLMVITVRQREKGADVPEALANALTGKSNIPSPACYTRFAMKAVR